MVPLSFAHANLGQHLLEVLWSKSEEGKIGGSSILLSADAMQSARINAGDCVFIATTDQAIPVFPNMKGANHSPKPSINVSGCNLQTLMSEEPSIANILIPAIAWPSQKLSKSLLCAGSHISFLLSRSREGVLLVFKASSPGPCSKLKLQLIKEHTLVNPNPSPSKGQAQNSKRPIVLLSDWVMDLFDKDVGNQRDLALRVIRKHLDGCVIHSGGMVIVPILGSNLFFKAQVPDQGKYTVLRISRDTQLTLSTSDISIDENVDDGMTLQHEQIRIARSAAEGDGKLGSSLMAADAAERSLRGGTSAMSSSDAQGYAGLGGVESVAKTLYELVTLPLQSPHLFSQCGVRPPKGVLLYGPPGSGKTALAIAAAKEAMATLFLINGADVVSEYFGESESSLRGIFAAAAAMAPSIIFMDEIDALAPARQEGTSGGMSARLVTALLTLMDGVTRTSTPDRVVVIGATNRLQALDPALRRPGRFEREIEIGIPNAPARLQILQARLRRSKHTLTEIDIRQLSDTTHGFVGADLSRLVDEASFSALRRRVKDPDGEPLLLSANDFASARLRVGPSLMREVAVQVPKQKWDDVGGLDQVKKRLQEVVEWPLQHSSSLDRLGITQPSGVLLYGPPGCSKTLLARAVANEAGLNFLSIKGGELLSKYVGESEKAVSSLFSRARSLAPSIIFFDEIDALAPKRSKDSKGGGGDRVLTQLLTEMDGIQSRCPGLIILGATNRPDNVDPALLRPGRFDRLIYVPPPDDQGREAILHVLLRNTPLNDDVDLPKLALLTRQGWGYYTGADLSSICREAALSALEENLMMPVVSWRHFEEALKIVPGSPALSQEMLEIYSRYCENSG